MTFLSYLTWAGTGILLALILLKTQAWAVERITPQYPKLSVALVVGGAIIRWLLIGAVFIMALRQSIGALLMVFAAMLVTRTLFLFLWQGKVLPIPLRSSGIKD